MSEDAIAYEWAILVAALAPELTTASQARLEEIAKTAPTIDDRDGWLQVR